MIIVGGVALAVWGFFNLYPQLQTLESGDKVYPAENLWTYGFGVTNGTQVSYNVYHASLGHNVTVSYTVVDIDSNNGTWKIAVEVTDGEVKENAYAITTESILPVGGSEIVGDLGRFAVATKMPVAEFMIGLKDQPLEVGASWQMAFLAPDNTYTRSKIVKKEDTDGQEVYVLSYGPEKTPSFTWIAKNYPVPVRDEYNEPFSGKIISVYELVEYKK
jgi:hypothetical protein